jgi:recombination protein RecT
MDNSQAIATKPIDKLKLVLQSDSVREQFKNALQDHSDAFLASVIDLFASDTSLQQCEPNRVVMECLKAATLKLPINRSLGFAYVIPYKVKGVMSPQFQIGYKGFIQLAMRTGQYKYLNAGAILEGQEVHQDVMTGAITVDGTPTPPEMGQIQMAIGYFAYLELRNGFSKALYMTLDEVKAHGKRYSRAFDSGPWQTNFDSMAMKTVLRLLLSKFGWLSTEMEMAMTSEPEDAEYTIAQEKDLNANKEELPPPTRMVQPTMAGQSAPTPQTEKLPWD